jgi:methionine sulfoxide reductase heme-binding subunit
MGAREIRTRLPMPWFDAAGRFSVLKLTTLLAICIPAYWMAVEFSSGRWDFPSPYVGLIYHSGLWATYLLLLSLLVTPLVRITGHGRLAQLRRMLGVTSFLYCVLHVVAWFGLRVWDWAELASELFSRATLVAAAASTVVLAVLAMTSFDAAMRAMGPRWKQLHRLVYPAAFLAVLHFLMSPGSLQGIPFLMAGGYAWLMGWRLLDRRGLGRKPWPLASLGLGVTAFTFLLQPVWLVTFQAERTSQTLLAAMADNFSPDVWTYLGVPPVWVLLGWTVLVASIAARRQAKTLPNAMRGM